jgi:hypothetical protein
VGGFLTTLASMIALGLILLGLAWAASWWAAKQMSGERRTDTATGEGRDHSELKAARRSTLTSQHGNGGL